MTGVEKARQTAQAIKQKAEAEKAAEAAAAKITADALAAKANAQLKPTTPPVTTGKTFGKFVIRKAERSLSRLRIGLAGPSGSGKTYSALLLAHGLAEWDKVAIIDTENGSADLYSDMGPYNVLTLEKPYHPDRYIEAIQAAEQAGMEVIIVDSITHEWNGQGGILELQDRMGGRFQDWAKVTPMHNRFVQTLLQAKCHIITTVRSKTDYAMSNDGGKAQVQKVGMKPETREGYEYEMTVSLDLNINNMVTVSKDRTGLFKNKSSFIITEDTGRQLLDWALSGVNQIERIQDLLRQKGKTQDPILNTYKILTLDDLTPAQQKAIITKLEGIPDYDAEAEKLKAAEQEKARQAEEKAQNSEPVDADEVAAGIDAQKGAAA